MNNYPSNWKAIALIIKIKADWKCIRCGHPHEPQTGFCLTVHHLDGDKSNCRWYNLPPLCQRCHLTIQARVIMHRPWLYEHSEWFKPYVAGYYASELGLLDDYYSVMQNQDVLLNRRMVLVKEAI